MTPLHLYIDIETIPSHDLALIDEIEAKHAVPPLDLSGITAAANLKDPEKIGEDIARRQEKARQDNASAVAKAEAAASEEWRKTCLDATTGHIACISAALGDAQVSHVENVVLRQYASGLFDVMSLTEVLEGEREMLTGFFEWLNDQIAVAAEGVLIARHQFMSWTLTRHGAVASRVVDEEPQYVERHLRHGPLSIAQPVVVAHHAQFDVRYIWQRCIILGVPVPAWWPVDARPWDVDRVDDTMLAWAGNGGRIGLDRLCRALGIPGKGEMDGSKVWDAVRAGRIAEVIDYCDGDVERLRAVHKRIRGAHEPQQRFFNLNPGVAWTDGAAAVEAGAR